MNGIFDILKNIVGKHIATLAYLAKVIGVATSVLAINQIDELIIDRLKDNFMNPMLQHVVAKNPGKSVICSAFSVVPPLYEIALATVGPSHEELVTALGVPDDSNSINAISKLNQQIRSVKGVTLEIANKIYIANDAKINKKFAEMTREKFNTEIQNIDFSNSQSSANEINAWVEDKTNHKIKNIVEPKVIEGARSILVNALYFKGLWGKKFDTNRTANKTFHVTKNRSIKVPTMSISEHFMYGESPELDAKLLELPYKGSEASFLIVLPNQIDGLRNLQENLKQNALLRNAIKQMTIQKVILSMPKFKIRTTIDLKVILNKMKITKIFSPGEAKLVHMLENESVLYISAAIQKAFIEVNEEGAEAAAANEFVPVGSSLIEKPEVNFEVCNPFYYEIRSHNTPLFNGVVVQPKI